MTTISKKIFFIPFIVTLLLIFVLPVAAQSGPTLTIPTGLAGTPGQSVRVPISLNAAGNEIRNIVFAVNYNEMVFTFNSFECNLVSGGTTIPCSATLNTANTHGEVNVVIGRTTSPLVSIPDGEIIALLLDIKPDAVLDIPVLLGFSSDPSPSFGNNQGQSVSGNGVDGSIGGGVNNTTPVANDDVATTDEDTAVVVKVLANDSDLENNILSVDSITQPRNGVAVNNGTTITYTPNADFSGTDSFTYIITDGSAVSNSATVNVIVNPVNDAPVAHDDSYSTDEDITLSVVAPGVLASDTDIDSNSLSVSLVSNVAHGTLTLNLDGSFTYAPAVNFNGTDSFTYKVSDGNADSNIATVTINVNAVNDAPTAVILSPIASTITAGMNGVAPVVLNSSGTSDVEDAVGQLNFLWSWTENGKSVTIAAAGAAYNFPVGTYNITLTVTDSGGLTDTKTVSITVVAPPNVAPTVNAGADAAITLPTNSVSLNGTASDDGLPFGSTLTTTWTGPVGVIFVDTHVLTTLATFPSVGNYVLTLTASDGDKSVSDTVTVTVNPAPNKPPTANAGPDQTLIDTDRNGVETVTLNGSASNDPDGTVSTYLWSENGTQIATGINPTVSLPVGTHTITLVVTDNNNAPSNPDTVLITVNTASNQSPTANAGPDQNLTDNDNNGSELVTLSGVASRDPDGSITTYAWFENGNPIASGVSPQVTLALGVHTITLIVTDNNGAQGIDQVVITIIAVANIPPTANAGPDQTVVDVDNSGSEAIALSSAGSVDRDGSIVSYVWQENGNILANTATSIVTLSVGTHILTLTVTDNRGASGSDTVSITILAPSSTTPTITTQINNASDDVNQDGQALNRNATTVWIGTGTNRTSSFTGLRFNGINIPRGSIINNARLEVYTTTGDWIRVSVTIAAEATDNSAAFTTATRPSIRILTNAKVNSNTNTRWLANTWNSYNGLGALVQEIINRSGWQSGNSLSLIIKGTGSAFGRKFVTSFEGNPAFAPRLVISYTAPVVQPPTAAFITNVVQGAAPLAVLFTNQSTGNNPTYSWNFGDGATSTETNPTHTFTTPGVYTVVLTASNTGGSQTAQTVVTVNAPIQPPIAAFSTDVVTGRSPLVVQFTNQSTGTNVTYSWNFGDGGTSTDVSPSHTFAGQGTYTVVLTVTNSAGPSTAQTIITVNAPPQPPVAVFSADVVTGTNPLVVQFTNQSTGDGITYSWNFGDGSTSTDVSPAHTFNLAGTYVVTLTVSNTVGTSTTQVSIQVTDPLPEATASPSG